MDIAGSQFDRLDENPVDDLDDRASDLIGFIHDLVFNDLNIIDCAMDQLVKFINIDQAAVDEVEIRFRDFIFVQGVVEGLEICCPQPSHTAPTAVIFLYGIDDFCLRGHHRLDIEACHKFDLIDDVNIAGVGHGQCQLRAHAANGDDEIFF